MSTQPSRILVYGMVDPFDDSLFYVGQTKRRREFRLLEHIEEAVGGSPLPVHRKVKEILDRGRIPGIFVLERVSDYLKATEVEVKWIRYFEKASELSFPMTIQPQTPKSMLVTLKAAKLTNIEYKLSP